MALDLPAQSPAEFHRLRLNTLIRLRWLALAGQCAAVLVVAFLLQFPLPIAWCFALIACSAGLNLSLTFRFPAMHLLAPTAALGLLSFDALQLAGLLYITGGLTNPFSLLMTVPVVISATSLPLRLTALLGLLVIAATTLLAFSHLPLPWFPGTQLAMPPIYVAGMWMALVSAILFTGVYAYRVAEEARLLANALSATELVLQREQHLSAPEAGLAAAAAHELGTPLATIALVVKEMDRALGNDARMRDDLSLLKTQTDRCREILKRLTNLSSESESHLARLPFTSLVEEVVAPHREFGIEIRLSPGPRIGPEPVARRNPGVDGLGNLVENAVDFARQTVTIKSMWDAENVYLSVTDDGPGFPAEILDRIGEPYMTRRASADAGGGGLGLGLFIAKTLLERSGATISFSNASKPGEGAVVKVVWPREAFVMASA